MERSFSKDNKIDQRNNSIRCRNNSNYFKHARTVKRIKQAYLVKNGVKILKNSPIVEVREDEVVIMDKSTIQRIH